MSSCTEPELNPLASLALVDSRCWAGAAVEACDGEGKFKEDAWTRENGGGGISRVLSGGKIWEKAGCNLSVVYGTMPSEALQAANDRRKFSSTDRAAGYKPGERVPFFACGLSSVRSPPDPPLPLPPLPPVCLVFSVALLVGVCGWACVACTPHS